MIILILTQPSSSSSFDLKQHHSTTSIRIMAQLICRNVLTKSSAINSMKISLGINQTTVRSLVGSSGCRMLNHGISQKECNRSHPILNRHLQPSLRSFGAYGPDWYPVDMKEVEDRVLKTCRAYDKIGETSQVSVVVFCYISWEKERVQWMETGLMAQDYCLIYTMFMTGSQGLEDLQLNHGHELRDTKVESQSPPAPFFLSWHHMSCSKWILTQIFSTCCHQVFKIQKRHFGHKAPLTYDFIVERVILVLELYDKVDNSKVLI